MDIYIKSDENSFLLRCASHGNYIPKEQRQNNKKLLLSISFAAKF